LTNCLNLPTCYPTPTYSLLTPSSWNSNSCLQDFMLSSSSKVNSDPSPQRAPSATTSDFLQQRSRQVGPLPPSSTHQNGSSSAFSRGESSRTMSSQTTGAYKRPTSSSSNHQSTALPPGAPSGSRINTVTYKVSSYDKTTSKSSLTSRLTFFSLVECYHQSTH